LATPIHLGQEWLFYADFGFVRKFERRQRRRPDATDAQLVPLRRFHDVLQAGVLVARHGHFFEIEDDDSALALFLRIDGPAPTRDPLLLNGGELRKLGSFRQFALWRPAGRRVIVRPYGLEASP
jgi:hypothetical protein